ncbi:type VI secretion system Vgr family protein, partial [Cupriavidus sp. KB_39]
PSRYPYAYLTQQGYYTVRFDFDFEDWPGGGECVPLRLAKPFAGALQTGFHFPLIDGTEAAIAFRDGNPNKPYIAHVHHNSRQTDLITNQDRWLSRNVIRTQSDNKLEFEDWEGQEHVKLSTEHSGKSQLTLGHMVDGKWKRRGEGFELRTSGWGAIRGGKGLFITADDQPKASGQQLDMAPAQRLLEQALQQS